MAGAAREEQVASGIVAEPRPAPGPGEMVELDPGLFWLRFPLPFALDHVNLWVLDDGDGWTLIDTGYGDEPSRALWEGRWRGRWPAGSCGACSSPISIPTIWDWLAGSPSATMSSS